MADVAPFRAIRYHLAPGSDATALLAPPYDVIDPAQRAKLASQHRANVVQIDLPEAPPEIDRYARAGERYREWMLNGTLVRDDVPSLTITHQTFEGPDGNLVTRKGLIASVKLEDFDAGVILPHEYTLRGPKEDRLKLFTALGATASQVFCVYDDPAFEVDDLLAGATREEPLMTAITEDGVTLQVWRHTGLQALEGVRRFFEGRTLLIADGHHRYETHLHYRDLQRQERNADDVPAGRVPIYLANMADPGTVVYPIHRLVRGVADFDRDRLLAGLDAWFDRKGAPGGSLEAIKAAMGEHAAALGAAVYALVFPDGQAWTFGLSVDKRAQALALIDQPEPLRSLDVTVLHSLVLDRLLGITAEDLAAESNVDYVKAESTFFDRLHEGHHQFGLLLPDPSARHVAEVAAAGLRMPQKSTYFFPKIQSGVVIGSLVD